MSEMVPDTSRATADRFRGNRAHTEWEHGPDGWRFTIHLRPEADADVLAHELAHVAARARHGIDSEVHGDEWQRLRDRFLDALGGRTRMGDALENLAGDVYLHSLGEITGQQLLQTQVQALAVLRGSQP